MQKSRILLVVLAIVFSNLINAQEKLSLSEAVKIAVQNSYDIKLVENTAAIAKNNNSYGVAGGLPTVSSTINNNNTQSTINQTFPDPSRNTTRSGVEGTTVNGSLNVSMILFNGFRVAATKDRLESIEKQSAATLQNQMLNTSSIVMQQYYNVVRQEAYLKTILKSIEASEQRVAIVKTRQQVGVANQADVLQSNIDLNALLQAKENQLLVIDQAKADLYNSMVVPANSNYTFDQTIAVDQNIKMAEVEAKMKDHPLLQSAQQLVNVNQFIEKETRATMYPTLRANTGYTYSSNKSGAGFILLNESYGTFIGVNLALPIYNGGASKRAYNNAKIATNSAKLQLDNATLDLNTELFKTYKNYLNSIKQTPIEQENFKMSQELLGLVMQKYQLGQATMVDVKQAQQSFETAGFRLTSLQFTAKLAEIELKRLSNQLSF
ncbi:MAG: TolC family protein [Sediminibacterium sp.]|jgi:outer membrane protein TolC